MSWLAKKIERVRGQLKDCKKKKESFEKENEEDVILELSRASSRNSDIRLQTCNLNISDITNPMAQTVPVFPCKQLNHEGNICHLVVISFL